MLSLMAMNQKANGHVSSGLKIFVDIAMTCLPLCILLGTFEIMLHNDDYLNSLASKTATPQLAEPKIPDPEAQAVSAEVVSYVRGGSALPMAHSSYFREEELLHLANVRKVMSGALVVFVILAAAVVISVAGIIALTKKLRVIRKHLLQKLFFLVGIETAVLAIIAVLASLAFDKAFALFHLILFRNGQWQFPQNYLLVNLFSTSFFATFARDLIVALFVESIVILVAATVVRKKSIFSLDKS